MRVLVTNDDGIGSGGLWALVNELKKSAEVIVVAPNSEQSAIGTAVTLRQTLRVQKVNAAVPEVEAYAVEGTPSDSVILALGGLVKRVDLVISGINQGMNLGEDVHISGTVSAALQAYLCGFPAMAISASYKDTQYLDTAARVAGILAGEISGLLPGDIFLNINLPDLPLAEIKGAKVTRLASGSHINTVEAGGNGQKDYYRLVRQSVDRAIDDGTDVWAVEQGNISITPLYTRRFNKSSLPILNKLCASLLQELRKC